MSVVRRSRSRHGFGLSMLFFTTLLASCDAPRTDFDRGVAAYQAKRYEQARPLMIQTAQAGNIDARAIAGSMLVMGQGGTRDAKEGVHWLRLAAEAGNASAQMMLGTLYSYGTGVVQNIDEAKHWLTMASKQGDGQAAVLLNKLNGKTDRAM